MGIFALGIIICLIFAGCELQRKEIDIRETKKPTQTFQSNIGMIEKFDFSKKINSKTIIAQQYHYPDEGTFICARYTAERPSEETIKVFESSAEGTIRWFNAEGKLQEQPLQAGEVTVNPVFIETDDISAIIYLPQVYISHQNQTIEALMGYSSKMRIEQTKNGLSFMLEMPQIQKGEEAEFMIITGPSETFLNWDEEGIESEWKRRQMTGDNRFTINGYYYSSPESYEPSGENYFYLLPAAYLTQGYIAKDASKAAFNQGFAMLDIQRQHQNARGFMETSPKSEWLLNDYEIGAGFYDTRFNTELFSNLLTGYEVYEIEEFRESVEAYLAFYERFALQNHIEVAEDAWLICDYMNTNGGKKTHASLNHHLSELLFLYRADDILGTNHTELIQKMEAGIQASEQKWIMPDNNLEYCMFPDGTMGLEDYPELTYNDMYHLQKWYQKKGMPSSETLERLMAAKLKWMMEKGVTTYLK